MKTTIPSPRSTASIYLPRAAISARAALWSILAGIAFPLPVVCLLALLPFPHLAATAVAASRITQVFQQPSWIVLLALIAFPVIEEGFYRGLLMGSLRRFLPLPVAVALPTLLFSLTHLGQGPRTALLALCAGGFFSWLVLRSRSLLSSILCHSAVNCSWLFIFTPIFVAHDIVRPADLARPLPLLLCTASLALLIAAVATLRTEFRSRAPAAAAAPAAVPHLA